MSRSKTSIIAVAAALAVAATSGAAHAGDGKKIVKNAAIGAGGGAVVGAVVPGVSVGEGALIGGAGGAIVGALDKDRKYYRDEQGRRYWIDKNGKRRYKD